MPGAEDPLTPSTMSAIAGISRVFEVVLESQGLTIQKYRVLTYLAVDPATPSALAYRLTVRPPTVSRLVHGLIGRGYVERRVDGGDRRSAVLAVTRAGEQAIRDADEAIRERIDRITGELAPRQRVAAERGLLAIGVAMRRYWAKTHPDA